jgi:hypothetical protein
MTRPKRFSRVVAASSLVTGRASYSRKTGGYTVGGRAGAGSVRGGHYETEEHQVGVGCPNRSRGSDHVGDLVLVHSAMGGFGRNGQGGEHAGSIYLERF